MKDIKQLISTIEQAHQHLRAGAVNAVNRALTTRNWLIGYYIVEYEQEGEDRAQYSSDLLGELSRSIKITGLSAPELSRCRQFFQRYPQILEY